MEDPENEGFGLVGVAPEATIAAYRVFGCNNGGTTNDVIIAAMLRAVQDGADVVSMSFGGGNGWELDDPFNDVVTQLVNSGVAVVAAIGNVGIEGLYWPQSPACPTTHYLWLQSRTVFSLWHILLTTTNKMPSTIYLCSQPPTWAANRSTRWERGLEYLPILLSRVDAIRRYGPLCNRLRTEGRLTGTTPSCWSR